MKKARYTKRPTISTIEDLVLFCVGNKIQFDHNPQINAVTIYISSGFTIFKLEPFVVAVDTTNSFTTEDSILTIMEKLKLFIKIRNTK